MDKKIVYIYYLIENSNIFYVGKTKNISKRKSFHKKTYGYGINLLVVDEIEDKDWGFWESYWISQFKTWGFTLKNKNGGGGGPTCWTDEQKLNINPDRIYKIKNHQSRGDNISKTLLENNHSKYYSDDIRIKISKSKESRNILQYGLDGNFIREWSSIGLASSQLKEECSLKCKNVYTQIRDSCIGRQKTCHGYKFKYKE